MAMASGEFLPPAAPSSPVAAVRAWVWESSLLKAE
jgi:hypothetical protein